MNRLMQWVIAAALICGATLFTSCMNDDNDRLEFFEDGTYKYWRKNDAGEWEEVTTREFQEYFVDGGFLCTRWKNIDENELREWWEIVTIKGDKMQWQALRQNENGSTFEQTMDWERVVE